MFRDKKIVALIPARAGSKGLINKNIKIFKKKPLIYWTIKAAQNSKYIDEIVVTTDSKRILNLSKKFKIKNLIKRPKKLALDNTAIKDVIFHSFKWIKKNLIDNYNYFILLQPTSPLRNENHINKFIRNFFSKKKKNNETMISVAAAPVKASWLMRKKGKYLNFLKKNKKNYLRQDLEKFYLPNGAIYFSKITTFKGSFYGNKTMFYEMDIKSSIDIDNLHDFKKGVKVKNNLE